MAAFSSGTYTTTEALDWEAGDFLRFDKFRDQVGQNIEYLKANLDAVINNNFWANFEQQLQQGVALGAPIG